jgi:hypothetical protein
MLLSKRKVLVVLKVSRLYVGKRGSMSETGGELMLLHGGGAGDVRGRHVQATIISVGVLGEEC